MATTDKYTLGIVLNEIDFGESSKIIKVFTRDFGKVSIMVKGVKSSRSRNLSVSQIFGVNEYFLKKGQSFYYISEAKIIESNFKIRENYENLIYASFILEILEKSSINEEANRKIFDLVRKTINFFNDTKDPISISLAFELKYLSFLGYRPKLDSKEKTFFSIREGIIDYADPYSHPFTKKDLNYLRNLLYGKLEEIQNIDYIDKNRKKFLHKVFIDYIKYNLEISSFKSDKLFS